MHFPFLGNKVASLRVETTKCIGQSGSGEAELPDWAVFQKNG